MKNRLFFASKRILAGIGRAQFGPPGSCIAKCLQWSRIVSFFTVCLLVAPPGSRFMQDHSLRAWIWIFHRDHNLVKISDQHTKRARHAPLHTHTAHTWQVMILFCKHAKTFVCACHFVTFCNLTAWIVSACDMANRLQLTRIAHRDQSCRHCTPGRPCKP